MKYTVKYRQSYKGYKELLNSFMKCMSKKGKSQCEIIPEKKEIDIGGYRQTVHVWDKYLATVTVIFS